jgi:CRISPR type III-A-associated protein Csm2
MADTEQQDVKPAEKPQGGNGGNDKPQGGGQGKGGGNQGNREGRGPKSQGGSGGDRGPRPDRGERGGGGGDRGDRGDRGPRPNRDRFEGPPEIELEKLMADSLYLDNQAHAVVSRMRDMDSGTRSQLRRFYSAVRRACRAADAEKQHEFVMLRARLAYTIARHQLRSLDPLEKLLLQVTRKNDTRGYERFRDLFEAIVAYNE